MSIRRYGKFRSQITEGIKDAATRQAFDSLDKRITVIEQNNDTEFYGVAGFDFEDDGASVDGVVTLPITLRTRARPVVFMCFYAPLKYGDVNNSPNFVTFLNPSDTLFGYEVRRSDGVVVASSAFGAESTNVNAVPASFFTGIDTDPPIGSVTYTLKIYNLASVATDAVRARKIKLIAFSIG